MSPKLPFFFSTDVLLQKWDIMHYCQSFALLSNGNCRIKVVYEQKRKKERKKERKKNTKSNPA